MSDPISNVLASQHVLEVDLQHSRRMAGDGGSIGLNIER